MLQLFKSTNSGGYTIATGFVLAIFMLALGYKGMQLQSYLLPLMPTLLGATLLGLSINAYILSRRFTKNK
jgi:membrane protein implicated in regulation of membrane protease activity